MELICSQSIVFINADGRDSLALDRIFQQHQIHSVIHFAGLKAVGESVMRDYIHVVDLAKGYVAALRYMENAKKSFTVNLGTGTVPNKDG